MATSIIILTGERGAGKTSACREAVTLAQAKEYVCGGILTLTQPDGELDVLDVSSGETRRPSSRDASALPPRLLGGEIWPSLASHPVNCSWWMNWVRWS
jgi:hypothetical protein